MNKYSARSFESYAFSNGFINVVIFLYMYVPWLFKLLKLYIFISECSTQANIKSTKVKDKRSNT